MVCVFQNECLSGGVGIAVGVENIRPLQLTKIKYYVKRPDQPPVPFAMLGLQKKFTPERISDLFGMFVSFT